MFKSIPDFPKVLGKHGSDHVFLDEICEYDMTFNNEIALRLP